MVINVLQSLVKTASIGLLRGLYTQILANRMAHDAEVSNHTVVRHFAQALQQAVGDTSYARAHNTVAIIVSKYCQSNQPYLYGVGGGHGGRGSHGGQLESALLAVL